MGHPGGSLAVEFLVALYQNLMEQRRFEMDGIGEDLFFLSNGHISVFYSVLARSGYFCFRISYISF
jgi:transketolase